MRRLFLRMRGSAHDIDTSNDDSTLCVKKTNEPLRKHFPVGIKIWHAPESSIVDIVFIHGLTGDREKTWSYLHHDPWPAILLPKHLPTSRILTYGFDAYVASVSGVVSKNTIANHAMNLVAMLATFRENDGTNTRPILYVCHSLGGLVCQDALVQARQSPESHLRQIYDCSQGIAFLGTPHRGSALAQWGLAVVLTRESEVLERVQDNFFNMIRSRAKEGLWALDMTCFYEELPLPNIGLVVPRESATLPGYVSISIHQNHMNMTKFVDEEDPGFIAIVGELRRWIERLKDAAAISKASAASPNSLTQSEKGFLASIGPRHFVDLQDRVDGTCVWMTRTTEFASWIRSPQSSVLWITGTAGTGKTMLANYLVEHLVENVGTDLVCSFFCTSDVTSQRELCSVIQDLVLQLTQSNLKVLREVKSVYGANKRDHVWSFETLWRMFETVLDMLPSECVYITIDALDECTRELRVRFIQRIAKTIIRLANKSTSKTKQIKLMLCGQPQIRHNWSAKLDSVTQYHVDIEDRSFTMNDVLLFVEQRVTELVYGSICSRSVGAHLKEVLTSMAENSFLWLDIVIKHIRTSLQYHRADLEKLLHDLPRDLQDAYSRYVPPVSEEDIPLLQRYLQLMTASKRPLKLIEIDLFTNLDDGKASSREVSPMSKAEAEEVTKSSIQRALGPLVKFPRGTAQFSHSTAKEFFILLAESPGHWLHRSHGVQPKTAHLFCARSCMSYLLDQRICSYSYTVELTGNDGIQLESPVSSTYDDTMTSEFGNLFDLGEVQFLQGDGNWDKPIFGAIQSRFYAYEYAAVNWVCHLVQCQDILNDHDMNMVFELLSTGLNTATSWYRFLLQETKLQMPPIGEAGPIVLAAMFGISRLLTVLLDGRGFGSSTRELFVALFWASARGSTSTVKILLQYDAPTSVNGELRRPLTVAAQGNLVDVCSLLLAVRSTDPNLKDASGKNALILASEANHAPVVQLLLSHSDTYVEMTNLAGQTALLSAFREGSTDSIRVLRHDGRADVNHADRNGRRSLHYVCEYGDSETLKELLQFDDLDLHATDRHGRNAMSIAAQRGDLDLVKTLYHKKVGIADLDFNGRNAISWAANSMKATTLFSGSKETVLEYIIRKCPHAIDEPDNDGWSPLAWALDTPGYLRSVEILLRSELVDVNRRDMSGGRSIVAWAASAGMTQIVKCLVETPGIDLCQLSSTGQTALSYAAANGMTDAVELLLPMMQHTVDDTDNYGRTATDWAKMNLHSNIAEMLRIATAQRNV